MKLRSAFEMGLKKFSILRHTLMEKSNLERCGSWVKKNLNKNKNCETEKGKEKEKIFITKGVKNKKTKMRKRI